MLALPLFRYWWRIRLDGLPRPRRGQLGPPRRSVSGFRDATGCHRASSGANPEFATSIKSAGEPACRGVELSVEKIPEVVHCRALNGAITERHSPGFVAVAKDFVTQRNRSARRCPIMASWTA